jgi:hypothetical protein
MNEGELLDEAVDEWLTVPDLAERLGLDVSRVRRLLQERRLIGVRRGDPAVFVVPGPFLMPGHLANPASAGDPGRSPAWAPLASLQGTVTVLADVGFSDEESIAWLFTPDDMLGTTPIEALRAGRKTEVRRRAALEL